jgi:23S rRNA (cytidine1920-2'-O)/16S rRNA (cytidine1409-2'-O)-methyltransferase
MERTNARKLLPGDLPRDLQFLTMDVSFIAASLILPAVIAAAFAVEERAGKQAVILVKPQFEAGREYVGKGGIVRDSGAHLQAIERVRQAVIANDAVLTETMESPITGAEGNREFLLYARF